MGGQDKKCERLPWFEFPQMTEEKNMNASHLFGR